MAAKQSKQFRSSLPTLPSFQDIDSDQESETDSQTTVILSSEDSPPQSQMTRKRKAPNDDDDFPTSQTRDKESDRLLKPTSKCNHLSHKKSGGSIGCVYFNMLSTLTP